MNLLSTCPIALPVGTTGYPGSPVDVVARLVILMVQTVNVEI